MTQSVSAVTVEGVSDFSFISGMMPCRRRPYRTRGIRRTKAWVTRKLVVRIHI